MRFLYIIGLFIISVTIQNQCMNTEKGNFSRQKHIVLYSSEGKAFPIEEWKIGQSNVLLKGYFRCQKACGRRIKTLRCNNANLHEIQLYSQACEWNSGPDFKKQFKLLSPEDQRTLIIVAGKYGENLQQKKLYSPRLIAQLCDAYFDANFVNKNGSETPNIKSHMEQVTWIPHCINMMVKENLPFLFPDLNHDDFKRSSTDEGFIQLVPVCIAGHMSGSYDGPHCSILTSIGDKKFKTFLIKAIDDFYEYHLTATTSKDEVGEEKNQCFIRCYHNQNIEKSFLIKHEDPIKLSKFSPSGEYLCTGSDKMVLLSKILRKENGELMITNFCMPTSIPCIGADFNKQSTALILSCMDINDCKFNLSLWDISNNDCVKKFERDDCFSGIFDGEGNRLLTARSSGLLTLWNTSDLSHIYQLGTLKSNGFFLQKAFGPDGKKWASVTSDGKIIFVDEIDSQLLYVEKELDRFALTEKKILTKIVYSPNGFFVAILYPNNTNYLMLSLYSALTYEKLGEWPTGAEGIGFTPDSHQIVLNCNDDGNIWAKIQLLNADDHKNVKSLWFDSSIHQLAVLRRLGKAYDNKDTVELYEEEQDYKALQSLPKNLRKIVEKSLPVIKVIDNKKELLESGKDVLKIIEDEFDDTVKKMQDWWKNF